MPARRFPYDPKTSEEWMECAVSTALGFRIRRIALMSYQVQYLDKYGKVSRVRPASREEVLMFRTLCTPEHRGPLPIEGPGFNTAGGFK